MTKRSFYVPLNTKQGVALTGRNHTGPACSVGSPIPTCLAASAPTVHVPGGWPAQLPVAFPCRVRTCPASPHTSSVTDDDRRQTAKQYWPIRRASKIKSTEDAGLPHFCDTVIEKLFNAGISRTA